MDGKCACKDGFTGDFCQLGKYTCCQGNSLLTTVYDMISPIHLFSFIFSYTFPKIFTLKFEHVLA